MKIVILDTGCSNLLSVASAIRRLGYQPIISYDIDIIEQSDALFLPGVGTSKAVMKQLNNKGLINVIKNYVQPVLGICLGMQLFGSYSEENNYINTLGIINTPVIRMKSIKGLSLPHMGWNKVEYYTDNYLFNNINFGSYFYFAHSYAMTICSSTIAEAKYGILFTAAIKRNNFFGVQFHPERSGKVGQQLLRNFLEMVE